MTFQDQVQLAKERHAVIFDRYYKYLECLDDPNTQPVTVFEPLGAKQLEELEFIRRVSKDLQKKKNEDMLKAAAKAVEETNAQMKETAVSEESRKE